MRSISGLKVAALAAAIALATSAPSVRAADVLARQLPGKGSIVSGSVSAGIAGYGTQTIAIGNAGDTGAANAVIDWGSGTDINPTRAAGFNLGPDATLTFTNGTNGTSGGDAAVLNIDSTGNPSQILGRLIGKDTSVFVANANGIIVGSSATISSTADVGMIANRTLAGTGSDFGGSTGSIVYTGAGGDLSVARGATIQGTHVLVAGGGQVNVDLRAFTGPSGSTTLSAGMASAGAGSAGSDNPDASLSTAGALPSGSVLADYRSAGSAFNSGTLVLGDGYQVAGLLTNSGNLTLPSSNGAVDNQGTLTTKGTANFSALTNDGTYQAHNINVHGGDLVNNGLLNGAQLVVVYDANVVNTGTILGIYGLSTASDALRHQGGDYSITNTGTIASYGGLMIDANRSMHASGSRNHTTGSVTSTGTLRLAPGAKLQIKGQQDVTLAGVVQTGSGASIADVSTSNPLGELILSSGGYNATVATPTFWTDGVLTVATPVAVSGAIVHGRQVRLLSNILSVNAQGQRSGNITIVAGSQLQGDYAVTIGPDATVSAHLVSIKGPTYQVAPTDGRIVDPNVLLQGTVRASWIYLGEAGQPLSDIYSDPSGLLSVTSSDALVTIAFTGNVGAAPSQAGDALHDYLSIRPSGGTLALVLAPVGYTDYGGSVDLLVDGNVNLAQPGYANSPAIYESGSAASPATLPNTRLVLQATGNIATDTGGRFYWPGYVYLGTIGSNADGSPAPATLGSGSITIGGNFSNVLPGSTASDGGIEFITANALKLGGHSVTTNANSAISFGSDSLTQQYADGTLGAGAFFGGTQGDGVVNYGPLDPSMFRTDAPTGP